MYDGAWTVHNQSGISPTADDQETVYIRWGMGPTNDSVTYCGWNIDDVSFTGVPVCPGDLDRDGEIGLGDLATLLANYRTTSGATYLDGDLDGDGAVNLADLAELLSVYGTVCS